MKKIILSLLCLCCVIASSAQEKTISIYVYVPEQNENIPQNCMEYLANGLTTVVNTDGLAAQNEYLTQFLLMPKVSIATKNVLATTQQQVVLTLDVNLQIVDNISGTVYASTTVNVKGVGTNETKAYNAAFRSVNKSNAKIKGLVSAAKEKIIAYYEAETENIIKKALLLAEKRNYEEAFYLLGMIPSQCSKYDKAISASLKVWQKYKDISCSKNLEKARAIWVANQDIDAANMAGLYLSEILQDCSCYADAQSLYTDIKSKVGDLWKFEMKQYDTEADLSKARIQAFQAIGVAYGKGQQPNIIITKPRRH